MIERVYPGAGHQKKTGTGRKKITSRGTPQTGPTVTRLTGNLEIQEKWLSKNASTVPFGSRITGPLFEILFVALLNR